MRTATIFYSNGEVRRTSVNGTNTEIQNYFKLGSVVNLGTLEDNLQTIEALTIENKVNL